MFEAITIGSVWFIIKKIIVCYSAYKIITTW